MTFVFRGPSTLTPIAERLVVELPLPVFFFSTAVCFCWDSNTEASAADQHSDPRATAAINVSEKGLKLKLIHIDF